MEKKTTHTPSSRKAFEMFDEVFDKVVAFPQKNRDATTTAGAVLINRPLR